jgi:ubiquitin carboxyl-terminal hydrolase L5
MKMQKYGGAEGGNNIRFCLLALVDGLYEKASDNLEFLKRERIAIQRRMNPGWESLVRLFHGPFHNFGTNCFGSRSIAIF